MSRVSKAIKWYEDNASENKKYKTLIRIWLTVWLMFTNITYLAITECMILKLINERSGELVEVYVDLIDVLYFATIILPFLNFAFTAVSYTGMIQLGAYSQREDKKGVVLRNLYKQSLIFRAITVIVFVVPIIAITILYVRLYTLNV